MPVVVTLLAPGFSADPAKFDLAVTLTRITFPYLLFVTLVTILSGDPQRPRALRRRRGRAGAAQRVASWPRWRWRSCFRPPGMPRPGASPSRAFSNCCWSGSRPGGWTSCRRIEKPRLDPAMRRFFKTLGPAVIGSAGVQLAMFADTIIASFLPTGAVSSLYYADRIYQLPLGVIGIAAGTVLLPEMSRRIAAGDETARIARRTAPSA